MEELKDELLAHTREVTQDDPSPDADDVHVIPDDLRRLKLAQVKKLLENQYVSPLRHVTHIAKSFRRTKLVEEAQMRLQRLSEPA